MGNLGRYQTMTTWAKKVHGPLTLGALIAFGGYLLFRGCEAIITVTIRAIKKWKNKQGRDDLLYDEYEVSASYIDNHGLALNPGDRVRVLEKLEAGVILVEKMGDDDNPYCMAPESLADISNYVI